jgi:hypothetical protein
MTMPDVPAGGAPIDADFGTEPTATLQPAPDASSGPRNQLRQVKEQVVGQARSSFRQARDRAASSLTESRFQAADQIGGMATAFRRTSEHLRAEDQRRAADLTESVAEQAERASSYLRERDFRAIRQDLEGLARREPALVLGVGFALGLLGARFFKSSGRHAAGGYDAGA